MLKSEPIRAVTTTSEIIISSSEKPCCAARPDFRMHFIGYVPCPTSVRIVTGKAMSFEFVLDPRIFADTVSNFVYAEGCVMFQRMS